MRKINRENMVASAIGRPATVVQKDKSNDFQFEPSADASTGSPSPKAELHEVAGPSLTQRQEDQVVRVSKIPDWLTPSQLRHEAKQSYGTTNPSDDQWRTLFMLLNLERMGHVRRRVRPGHNTEWQITAKGRSSVETIRRLSQEVGR